MVMHEAFILPIQCRGKVSVAWVIEMVIAHGTRGLSGNVGITRIAIESDRSAVQRYDDVPEGREYPCHMGCIGRDIRECMPEGRNRPCEMGCEGRDIRECMPENRN